MTLGKHRLWFFVAALAMGFASAGLPDARSAEDAGFVTGTEDIPLMTELREDPGGDVVFDTPGGRIVEVFASGSTTRSAVEAFYAATLPQLGWRRIDAVSFRREDELLRLEITEGTAGVTVRFSLSPGAKRSDRRKPGR